MSSKFTKLLPSVGLEKIAPKRGEVIGSWSHEIRYSRLNSSTLEIAHLNVETRYAIPDLAIIKKAVGSTPRRSKASSQ